MTNDESNNIKKYRESHPQRKKNKTQRTQHQQMCVVWICPWHININWRNRSTVYRMFPYTGEEGKEPGTGNLYFELDDVQQNNTVSDKWKAAAGQNATGRREDGDAFIIGISSSSSSDSSPLKRLINRASLLVPATCILLIPLICQLHRHTLHAPSTIACLLIHLYAHSL